jgi:hypothetical protein
MNDLLSTELLRISLAHPALDYLTLREIFMLTPISKAMMAATQHRRLHLANRRLIKFSEVLASAEQPPEAVAPVIDIQLPLDIKLKTLAAQLTQPLIAHFNPFSFSQQKTIPQGAHLLLKPPHLRNLLPPEALLATNRLSRILGEQLLVSLHASDDARAEEILAAGADINLERDPAVTVALDHGRFHVLESILAEDHINIARFKPDAEDTKRLLAATAKQLETLITLSHDNHAEQATALSEKLFTTLISLLKLGLSKEILYQMLMLQHEDTSFLHWIAQHNKTLMYAVFDLLSDLLVDNTDVEQIAQLCSLTDGSLWTIGHIIIYYTNSTLTKKYLTLLSNLQAKGFSTERLANLIASANATHFTIGHYIGHHSNPTANQQFLTLLTGIINQSVSGDLEQKLDAHENSPRDVLLNLLQLKNDNDNTIGHILTDDGTIETMLQFFALLRELQKTHPKQTQAILHTVDRDNSTFGHKLPSRMPEYVTQAYLDMIDAAITDETSANATYELLVQQNNDRWNLAHAIADFSTHENRLRYLKIIIKLHQHGIPAENILFLLQLQTDENKNFLHYLASNKDSSTAELLINFLNTLILENHVSFPAIFNLLNTSDHNKTFAQYYFENLNTRACIILLDFLESLSTYNPADEATNSLLKLLNSTTKKDNQNCAVLVAIHQKETLPHYLRKLIALASNSASRKNIFNLLIQQDIHGLTFGNLLARHNDINLIRRYLLLCREIFDNRLSTYPIYELVSQVTNDTPAARMDLPVFIRRVQQLNDVVLQAESLSDDEIATAFSPLRFYNENDITTAFNEILHEFGLNASDTWIIQQALLSIFNITPSPIESKFSCNPASPFKYPYIVHFGLKYSDSHVDEFRAPPQAKMQYNPTPYKSLYFDIEYFIKVILAKEGPLALHMRKLAHESPQLFAAYQSYSSHEILPDWYSIRKNLYATLGEHGAVLFKNSNLFHYVLLKAFKVNCELSGAYTYDPTLDHSLYIEFTTIFRLGVARPAALKLVDNINAQFGNSSATVVQSEGVFKGFLLMFDIAISKKLLDSPEFRKLMALTYKNLLKSPDRVTQNYIDNQFIAAKLLPQSYQNLALQLAEFDACHIPASKNARAMTILIHLVVELRTALAEPERDANKLRTLTSLIYQETHVSTLITKFGMLGEARQQLKPVEEITTALQKRLGPSLV